MGSDGRDDVDRLFDCFRCGISTPESALTSSRKKRRQGVGLSVREEEARRGKVAKAGSAQLDKSGVTSFNLDNQKQISPVVFYGSPHGVPAKRPAKLLRLLREIHVDLREQNDLGLRNEVWVTFPKQEQAMRFAKNHSEVYVFSYQDHFNGQRRFLVSTYEEFWRRYINMDSKFRHHYEVIQEGFPCHIYFDLEYNKAFNGDKNGNEMVDLLLEVLFDALYEKYSIQAEKDWIVELDSSTEDKFSRHLVVRIPGIAFKDNSHVGAFVDEICSRISGARDCDPRLDKLYVLKDLKGGPPCHLFLDTAVYSRNRCFRLALSSKAGKSSVLLPSGRFKCAKLNEQEMFLQSLICKLDSDCKKLLICKMDSECIKTLRFDSEANDDACNNYEHLKNIVAKTCISNLPMTFMTGKSPFPALDAFVESIGSFGSVSGQIRSWYWFSEHGVMVYSMSKSRYCENIDREHKSNHVMYIVDFKLAGYYQKCYDPDCKGYRSPLRPVPRNAIPDDVAIRNMIAKENNENPSDFTNGNCDALCSNEKIIDSCKKDVAWWLEAIRLAEDMEKTTVLPECGMVNDDALGFSEDNDWWTDVERTASLIEQQISTQ